MNKIIVNKGSFKLDEIELHHGTITIGRAADNDIRLDDSAVSSHHAKVVTLFDVSFIQDTESTNGTLVNGKTVKKHTLHPGDIISLGKHQLLFQGESKSDADSNETLIINRQDMQDMLTDYMDKKQSSESRKPTALEMSAQRHAAASQQGSKKMEAKHEQEDVATIEKQTLEDTESTKAAPKKESTLELDPSSQKASFIPQDTQDIFDKEQTHLFQEGDEVRNPAAANPAPKVTRAKTVVIDPSADEVNSRKVAYHSAPRQAVSDATLVKMIIQKDGHYSRKGKSIFGSMQTVLGFLFIAILAAISYIAFL